VNCVNIGTVNQEIFLNCHEENVSVLFIFMICTILSNVLYITQIKEATGKCCIPGRS